MLRRVAIGLVLALLVALPGMAQDYQRGHAAAKRGDYAAALKEWRPLAEQGNPNAQVMMGFMYERGMGVNKDYVRAYSYYDLAYARYRGKARRRIAKRRKAVASKLAPEQLEASKTFGKELWLRPPSIYLDQNDDGRFTVSDIGQQADLVIEWIYWTFFLPGNYGVHFLVSHLDSPGIVGNLGRFLEISPTWYGGWISGICSALILMIVLVVYGAVRDGILENSSKLGDSVDSFFSWVFGPIVRLFKRHGPLIYLGFIASLILLPALTFFVLPFDRAIGVVIPFGVIGVLLGFFRLVGWLDTRRIKRRSRGIPDEKDAE